MLTRFCLIARSPITRTDPNHFADSLQPVIHSETQLVELQM